MFRVFIWVGCSFLVFGDATASQRLKARVISGPCEALSKPLGHDPQHHALTQKRTSFPRTSQKRAGFPGTELSGVLQGSAGFCILLHGSL